VRKSVRFDLMKRSYRIKELEDIICPAQSHDWVEVSSEFTITSAAPVVDGDMRVTYECTGCKKFKTVRR
jgi:hypothetical protein